MTTYRLKAGAAEGEISSGVTPQLRGEWGARTATGVETPLQVKALVLADGQETLAIVTLDLFGLEREGHDKVTRAISERSGMSPDSIMLICSHTRSGLYTIPAVGGRQVVPADLANIESEVAAVVAQAQAKLQDAVLGVGHALLPHLVFNHRLLTRNRKAISAWMGVPQDEVLTPEGAIDPTFSLIVIRDSQGHPLSLLWNFAADNRFGFEQDAQVSAGLPYFVQQEVDARNGKHLPCLYLAGCGGDTSFSRILTETAGAIADAVMAVSAETGGDPAIRLGHASESMILPIRDYTDFRDEADIRLKYPEALESYAQELDSMRQVGALAVPTAVQVFRFGRFALVGLPGMPFANFALSIKQASPFAETLVAANANGYVGYVIPRHSFDSAGYESWTSRAASIGPGGGEFLAEEAVGLLQTLKRS